ncbi:unnamed protein product [Gongylonema pulchrum]|uniref:Hint domain-containing protein n=1 Tax=Gongylonema pulchrum TaxID=637853 RepID=A0A3P7NGS8_9BILA|nr:unnamed protein product [Gongylonema pulchrum]
MFLFQVPIEEAEPIPLQQVTVAPQQVQPVPPPQQSFVDSAPNALDAPSDTPSTALGTGSVGSAEPVFPAYGRGGSNCFSGDTTVRTYDGREIQLQHLNSSEWVMTKYKNEITFAQITSWLHRLPDKEVNFYRIILKDGSQLKLTAKHYIYKTTCDNLLEQKVDFETIEDEAEWATNVNIGDCLYRVRNVEVNFAEQLLK